VRSADDQVRTKRDLYAREEFAERYFRQRYRAATGQLVFGEERAILTDLIPPGMGQAVADVGTGNGRFLGTLAGLGYRPVGVDLALPMLVRTQEHDAWRACAAAGQLPFSDGTLHGVLAHRFLYHCSDVGALLREFARVLSPGGWVCADVVRWSPSGIGRRVNRVVRAVGGRDASGHLVHVFPTDALRTEIERAGLRVVRHRDAFALNPASCSFLPSRLARHVLLPASLPWLPRAKRYLLLERVESMAALAPDHEQVRLLRT
jgi:SAM-dependent methyltransferase